MFDSGVYGNIHTDGHTHTHTYRSHKEIRYARRGGSGGGASHFLPPLPRATARTARGLDFGYRSHIAVDGYADACDVRFSVTSRARKVVGS